MKISGKRMLALMAAMALMLCAAVVGAGASSGAPTFLEVGDTLLNMYQKNPDAPFWELTEEQQNAALVLMAAGQLSQEEAYEEPEAAIAERIAEQAAEDDLLIRALNLWRDDGQYVVPHCTFAGGSAVLDIQSDEQINLIQQDDQGRWVAMPSVSGQTVTLPPNTLFIYFYPYDDDVAAECISRTPSEDGYTAEPATDPEAMTRRSDKLRCGHPVGSSGKHGRIITCGRYVCEDNHGNKHEQAPCGIKGHFLCDNKDHQVGVCAGEPLNIATPQPQLAACGQHPLGAEGDHTPHSPCGQWHCVGTHDVAACGNHEHCALDGKSHAAATCGIQGHSACDGGSHAALACKKHFACNSGGSDCDHSAPQEPPPPQESNPQEGAPQE